MPFFRNSIPSGHRPGTEGGGGSPRYHGTRDEAHAHIHAEVGDSRSSSKKQLLKSLVRRGTQRGQGILDANKKAAANNNQDDDNNHDDKVAAGGLAPNAKDKSVATREVSSGVSFSGAFFFRVFLFLFLFLKIFYAR